MLPAVYQLLRDSSAVTAAVGTRIYRHGDAPQDVTRPYITWSVISGAPENALDEAPRIDNQTVQVNVWHDSDTGIETLAKDVRDAIEAEHHITQGPTNSRDPETMRYRISFIFTFWNHRS
jgi:hypothetical protein